MPIPTHDRWLTFVICSLVVVVSLVTGPATFAEGADGDGPSVEDWRAVLRRLEQLEQDNQKLREEIKKSHAQPQRSIAPEPAEHNQTTPFENELGSDEVVPLSAQFAATDELPPLPPEPDRLATRSGEFDSLTMGYVQRLEQAAREIDSQQDSRIAKLEKAQESLLSRLNKKTFPSVTINGVFQADAGWFSQDTQSLANFGKIQDGVDFRRFRLSAKGQVVEGMNYFAQVDFGFFGRPTIQDLWVEQTQVPIFGNVRVGQWKQPFTLEVVSSFRYTTFMERSLLFQPFTPFRHVGVGFYNNSEDLSMTWAASVFRTGQDQFGGSIASQGGWGTAERITFLPYWDDVSKGANYLHLGLGHFFNAPPNDRIRFRSIPEFYVGENAPGAVGTSGQAAPGAFNGTPFFVDTGSLDVNNYNVLGTELLWVQGPLSLQSEGMVNFVQQGLDRPNVILPGAYAQVGYFLTGEHRPYDRKLAQIDRVIPNRNFRPGAGDAGYGAWEVAARWSYLDLNDKNVNGGNITDFTFGTNWYLNPYCKVVFNYIRAMPNNPVYGRSATDIFGFRTQLDF